MLDRALQIRAEVDLKQGEYGGPGRRRFVHSGFFYVGGRNRRDIRAAATFDESQIPFGSGAAIGIHHRRHALVPSSSESARFASRSTSSRASSTIALPSLRKGGQ